MRNLGQKTTLFYTVNLGPTNHTGGTENPILATHWTENNAVRAYALTQSNQALQERGVPDDYE